VAGLSGSGPGDREPQAAMGFAQASGGLSCLSVERIFNTMRVGDWSGLSLSP